MTLSIYCKTYTHREDPDSLILFSTKKASIIHVPKSMLNDIEKGNLSAEEKETLSELEFLVDDINEDKDKMLRFIEELNTINKKFTAIVVMNLDCNLACKYCFEGQRKGRFYMTKETADLFFEFVKNNVLSDKEEITITFYGGEPLLSKELIIYISKKMKAISESKGMRYSFSFITNGTLLTPDIVEKLKPLGLKSASITLDGPKDVHDRFRPFRSGKGSFDVILKNVRDVCDMMDIQIGGNFTEENYGEFPRLLDLFIGNKLTPDKISLIKFDPVLKEREGIAPPDFRDGCETINEPWLFDAGILLREDILKRGYKTQRIIPGSCMIEYRDNLVINYDGGIYKCPGLIGREQFRIGDLNIGIRDYTLSHNLKNWKNAECLDCSYLPLCFGGCRYMKLVRDDNIEGVDCKKPYFDAMLEALILQDVRYGLGVKK